jgi:hypothetical protein
MPSFNIGALDAVTDGVPVGSGAFTANVSGTFVGTVLFEYRTTPRGAWEAMSRDAAGTALSFTAPSGVFVLPHSEAEPDGQVRARMSAYTSGTASVRIGL